MKPNDRSTLDMQNAIVARMREDALAAGYPNAMLMTVKAVPPAKEDSVVIIYGTEIPLRQKHQNNEPFKYGGKKRKNSNSGGQGRAGRRAKRPHVPSGIR